MYSWDIIFCTFFYSFGILMMDFFRIIFAFQRSVFGSSRIYDNMGKRLLQSVEAFGNMQLFLQINKLSLSYLERRICAIIHTCRFLKYCAQKTLTHFYVSRYSDTFWLKSLILVDFNASKLDIIFSYAGKIFIGQSCLSDKIFDILL